MAALKAGPQWRLQKKHGVETRRLAAAASGGSGHKMAMKNRRK